MSFVYVYGIALRGITVMAHRETEHPNSTAGLFPVKKFGRQGKNRAVNVQEYGI